MKNISRLVVIYNNKQTSKNNKNIDIDTNFQNFADDLLVSNIVKTMHFSAFRFSF